MPDSVLVTAMCGNETGGPETPFQQDASAPATWQTFDVSVTEIDDPNHRITLSFHLVGTDQLKHKLDVTGKIHLEPE